jgi:hypothetical protein
VEVNWEAATLTITGTMRYVRDGEVIVKDTFLTDEHHEVIINTSL